MPIRVQRRRSKGWKMPENAVYVGRPTVYGNSTRVDDYWSSGFSGSEVVARQWTVDEFRGRVMADGFWSESFRAQVRRELRGKDLACWCQLGSPCHADVLLEIANAD